MSILDTPTKRNPGARFEQYEGYLIEMAGLLAVKADLLAQHAAIGDHAGVKYDVRGLIAITKAIAGAVSDIEELKAERQTEGAA